MNLYKKWRNLDKIESLENKVSYSEATINDLRKELTLKEEIIQSTQKHNLMLTENYIELKELLESEKYEEVVLNTSSSFTKADAESFDKEQLITQCKQSNEFAIGEEINNLSLINHKVEPTFGGTEIESTLKIYIKK